MFRTILKIGSSSTVTLCILSPFKSPESNRAQFYNQGHSANAATIYLNRYELGSVNRPHSVGGGPRPGPLLDTGNLTDVHAGVQIAQRSPSTPADQAQYRSLSKDVGSAEGGDWSSTPPSTATGRLFLDGALTCGADIPEWNARSSALRHVAALGDAEHLTGINPVRVLQHRVVGGEDRHIGVGIAVDLAGDLGQGVAGLDGVEAGFDLAGWSRAGWRRPGWRSGPRPSRRPRRCRAPGSPSRAPPGSRPCPGRSRCPHPPAPRRRWRCSRSRDLSLEGFRLQFDLLA